MQKKKDKNPGTTPSQNQQYKTPNSSSTSKKSIGNTPTKSPSHPLQAPKFSDTAAEFITLDLLAPSSKLDGGSATLSPSALLQLGIYSGELLKIIRASGSGALPPFTDYASSGLAMGSAAIVTVRSSAKIPSTAIELDAQSCENCGAVVGSAVEVRAVKEGDVIEATECFLSCLSTPSSASSLRVTGTNGVGGDDESLALTILSHALVNRHFVPGNILECRIYGILQRWKICTLLPSPPASSSSNTTAPYRITIKTKLKNEVKREEEKRGEEMVVVSRPGGLDEQIAQLESLLRLPLTNQEIFRRYGIRSPKAALLCGPPGTGKTHIVRYLAYSTRASLFVMNGPDILTKYYGETEAKIREIFRDAKRKAPSIIFIDEIDALCPKREEATTGTEKRVVGSLLSELDALHDTENSSLVVVLAATNRPNSLDESLRRPGRFDAEIQIPVPSATARLNILRGLLRKETEKGQVGVSHRLSEAEIEELASRTHGYVGADLQALCKEAALVAIRRWQKTVHGEEKEKRSIFLQRSDFDSALVDVRPSALREIVLEIPKVLWSDIGGQEDIKQRLQEAVEWPLRHPEAFTRMGIRPPRGVLLYGPPGCSKTLIAKALATQSGQNFLAVKGPELLSKYVGDSEKAVREIFRKARATAPAILFFDEIDALAVKRGASGEEGTSATDRVLSQLLTELDGVGTANAQVLLVAATNRPDILDKALLRPGRIDRILYVSPPNLAARSAIFHIHLRKTPHDLSNEQILELSEKTEGFSGAEVASVCREAGMSAMRKDHNAQKVSMSDFLCAISGIQPRITPDMLQFYADFREQNTLQSL